MGPSSLARLAKRMLQTDIDRDRVVQRLLLLATLLLVVVEFLALTHYYTVVSHSRRRLPFWSNKPDYQIEWYSSKESPTGKFVTWNPDEPKRVYGFTEVTDIDFDAVTNTVTLLRTTRERQEQNAEVKCRNE